MALIVANHTTDGNGVQSWDATSVYNGPGTTVLRVKTPTAPMTYQAHKFLYVLPVKPLGVDEFSFGDGLEELRLINAHHLYHCTMIAPSFHLEPYIGDHPTNTDARYETFLAGDLRSWVIANFTVTGVEEHWIISFSKGGVSSLVMLMRHPTLFHRAVCWDGPALKASVEADLAANTMDWDDIPYGTEANYDTKYDLITLVDDLAPPFLASPRIWLSGDNVTAFSNPTYKADMDTLHATWLSAGVQHLYSIAPFGRLHHWYDPTVTADKGWLGEGLEGMYQSPRVFVTKPTVATFNAAHPLNDGLEVGLLFAEGTGTTVSPVGQASLPAATLETGMTWGTHPYTGHPVLVKLGDFVTSIFGDENGLNFGTTYTGLDVSDKTLIIWCAVDKLNDYQALVDQDFDLVTPGDYGGWCFLVTPAPNATLEFFAHANKNLTDTGIPGIPVTDRLANMPLTYWRMLAVTWDSTTDTARFYIDGVLNSTVTDATIVEQPTGTADLLIGAARNQTTHPFSGAFDQVRLYNRILTGTELQALFENPFTEAAVSDLIDETYDLAVQAGTAHELALPYVAPFDLEIFVPPPPFITMPMMVFSAPARATAIAASLDLLVFETASRPTALSSEARAVTMEAPMRLAAVVASVDELTYFATSRMTELSSESRSLVYDAPARAASVRAAIDSLTFEASPRPTVLTASSRPLTYETPARVAQVVAAMDVLLFEAPERPTALVAGSHDGEG